jgi:ABC-type branched-subunit amino acid transport system ATPase component
VTDRVPVLEAAGLVAGYLPEVDVLRGVDAVLGETEIVAVLGPNGAGKSTLLKAMCGVLRPKQGKVTLRGVDITGWKPYDIARCGLSYVPQLNNVFPGMTVEENLQMGTVGRKGVNYGSRAGAVLELFPLLARRLRQHAGTMSGGERQMLAIAMALIPGPDVLILDEPSAGLAPAVVDLVFDRIGAVNKSGVAILMVEQNTRRALEFADRAYILDLGRNRLDGPGRALLADPQVGDLYLGKLKG